MRVHHVCFHKWHGKIQRESQSAPWLPAHCWATRADLVYVSKCEAVRFVWVRTLCVTAKSFYDTAKPPCHVFLFWKEPSNIYCFCAPMILSLPSFLSLTCFKSALDKQDIHLQLCNMIWGKTKWEQLKQKSPSCWASCPTVCSYFSAHFTAVGSWLIVSLLSFFFRSPPSVTRGLP